jgi:undecaprenyl-diphosphatase
MTIDTIKVAGLAVLQGVTEILPVSSSGHLVLGKHLLGLNSPGTVLEAVLHGGTLLAIVLYYRNKLVELVVDFFSGSAAARRDVAALVIGCIPAAIAGVLFEDRIDAAFGSARLVGYCLMVTGLLLLLPKLIPRGSKPGSLSIGQAFIVGLAQMAALLPGVSRSGTTITAARMTGAGGKEAAQFSFLMAIPLLAGALGLTLLKLFKSGDTTAVAGGDLAVGFVLAAAVGYLAMVALNRLLASQKLWWFGPYCLLAGLAAVLWIRDPAPPSPSPLNPGQARPAAIR